MVSDFRIPNNWDSIGQALSEAAGGGAKATQLLEENHRSIEDAITRVQGEITPGGDCCAPILEEVEVYDAAAIDIGGSISPPIALPEAGMWLIEGGFQFTFTDAAPTSSIVAELVVDVNGVGSGFQQYRSYGMGVDVVTLTAMTMFYASDGTSDTSLYLRPPTGSFLTVDTMSARLRATRIRGAV